MNKPFAFFLLFCFSFQFVFAQPKMPYKNAAIPIDQRVQDLLPRMTIEEKFWQLFMISGEMRQRRRRKIQERNFWIPGGRRRTGRQCRCTNAQLQQYGKRSCVCKENKCHAALFCRQNKAGHSYHSVRRSPARIGARRCHCVSAGDSAGSYFRYRADAAGIYGYYERNKAAGHTRYSHTCGEHCRRCALGQNRRNLWRRSVSHFGNGCCFCAAFRAKRHCNHA